MHWRDMILGVNCLYVQPIQHWAYYRHYHICKKMVINSLQDIANIFLSESLNDSIVWVGGLSGCWIILCELQFGNCFLIVTKKFTTQLVNFSSLKVFQFLFIVCQEAFTSVMCLCIDTYLFLLQVFSCFICGNRKRTVLRIQLFSQLLTVKSMVTYKKTVWTYLDYKYLSCRSW